MVKLIDLTTENINEILEEYNNDGGNELSISLKKLFSALNDEENKYEVSIKASALNQLYSTAIQYINPVVDTIVEKINSSHVSYTTEQYVDLVDAISISIWNQKETGELKSRKNLSFSSKYVHYISNCKTPIYDSYIWILIVGYLNFHRKKNERLDFHAPNEYKDFHQLFEEFKNTYKLQEYSNYQLDKFLWQYGKNLVTQIMSENKFTMSKAKSELQKRITKTWCGTAPQPHK